MQYSNIIIYRRHKMKFEFPSARYSVLIIIMRGIDRKNIINTIIQ